MARKIHVEDAAKADIIKAIKKGAVFVMPIDTAYCIACNALLPSAVETLRAVRSEVESVSEQRLQAACSSGVFVIAPSKKWIEKNFNVKKAFLDKLPGPFTYVLNPKRGVKGFSSAIGVRLFEHPVLKAVEKANVPLLCAEVQMKKLPIGMVDFAIDAGVIAGAPSAVIDFTGKFPLIVKR
ncbi:MAG: Sua5/YciO/YrdC/YwlC family protein [Nanoarchaeota archaeon]|nr:Sua5/YciO/YrdC/YwlC family protein [Nanoarchaeota archaeon]